MKMLKKMSSVRIAEPLLPTEAAQAVETVRSEGTAMKVWEIIDKPGQTPEAEERARIAEQQRDDLIWALRKLLDMKPGLIMRGVIESALARAGITS